MSLTLKVNFKKGWPCPSIVDAVANPATGVTVDEGLIAHLDANGAWVLGIDVAATAGAHGQVPYILWNGAAGDGDNNRAVYPLTSTQGFAQVGWGGVQGIALINQIEVETAQFLGTPAKGDQLYADLATGKLAVAITAGGVVSSAGKIIIAVCTAASHKMASGPNNVSVITFIPDHSKRTS